ncbi:hypothetical protein GCM10010402_75270 [Actinomadura luteofluorescens]
MAPRGTFTRRFAVWAFPPVTVTVIRTADGPDAAGALPGAAGEPDRAAGGVRGAGSPQAAAAVNAAAAVISAVVALVRVRRRMCPLPFRCRTPQIVTLDNDTLGSGILRPGVRPVRLRDVPVRASREQRCWST